MDPDRRTFRAEIAVRIPADGGLERHLRGEVPTPMAMHRQHPGPQFDLPVPPAPPALPAASVTHPRSVDMTVCEWTADLAGAAVSASPGRTSVSAVGFVDFDAVDSIHETATASGTTTTGSVRS